MKIIREAAEVARHCLIEIEGCDPVEMCEVGIEHDSLPAHDMDALLNFGDRNKGRSRFGHKGQANGGPEPSSCASSLA